MGLMEKEKKKNLSNFIRTFIPLIKSRLAYTFCCSYRYSKEEITRFFHNLCRKRIREFLKANRTKRHPLEARQVEYMLNQLPRLVNYYEQKIRRKITLLATRDGYKKELGDNGFT